jgi:hypothetical protein
VKVHVNHTKHVKSLHGVIITLYRQARVDMHPAIPLGPSEKGTERKYEDYYPKSVTGLGGLSLSGAGSSHVFRKDLSQTIVPLIVDPRKLTAEVTGKVNVPDEAFPTISTVPGAMISFRYFIEVILDIQGKLSSQDRNLGNLGGLTSTIAQAADPDPADGRHGPSVIDTSAVRRNMGVVACTFEVIIGTRDSARRKGKQKADPAPESQPEAQAAVEQDTQAGATPVAAHNGNGDYWQGGTNGSYDQRYYDQQYYDPNYYEHGYDEYNEYPAEEGYFDDASYAMPPPIPLPHIEDESQLPEKERIRRAEARLFPSMPPGADQPGPSGEASTHAASAPYIEEEHLNGYSRPGESSRPSFLSPHDASGASASGSNTVPVFANTALLLPTPAYDPRDIPLPPTPLHEQPHSPYDVPTPSYEHANGLTLPLSATDDKRELQRQRLQMEASAPPAEDVADEPGPAPHDHDAEPTAPVLSEAEEAMLGIGSSSSAMEHGQAQAGAADADADLPRYER